MFLAANRSALRALTALGLVPALVLGMLLMSPTAHAQKIKPDFFGMHDTRAGLGALTPLPIGSVRLWDTKTTWRDIETSPGNYNFARLDKAVTTAMDRGADVMIVLGQTPSFHATADPDTYEAFGDGATSMPKLKPWKKYVKAVAKRYKNTVEYQVWNEANVINYWSGTPAQMAKLTATASKMIQKAAGKKAKVVAPAFPLRLKSQRKWYAKYWSSKVGGKSMAAFVDVTSANLYPLDKHAPEHSMKLLKFAKKALPKAARGKPMWNTEINYGMRGGAAPDEIPEAKQAAFVSRTLLLNAGSPIRRVYWYSWDIGPITNTHLSQSDRHTPTQAGHAWTETRNWTIKTNFKGCKVTKTGKLKGLYTCTAKKGKKEVRRFYWKPTGGPVKIRTHKTTTRWTVLDGIDAAPTSVPKRRVKLTIGETPVMVASKR